MLSTLNTIMLLSYISIATFDILYNFIKDIKEIVRESKLKKNYKKIKQRGGQHYDYDNINED